MTPRTRCAASGTMARSSGKANWCFSARPSATSRWAWRKPSGGIGSCGSCTSNWGALIALRVGLRRRGTVGGVGRHRDRDDRCGNAVAMETPHRFPQRLGNLAPSARFPHSHNGSSWCGSRRRQDHRRTRPESVTYVSGLFCYPCIRLRRTETSSILRAVAAASAPSARCCHRVPGTDPGGLVRGTGTAGCSPCRSPPRPWRARRPDYPRRSG